MGQQMSVSLAEFYENRQLNRKYGTKLPTNQFEAGNVFHNAAKWERSLMRLEQ
jgi:hypothetical protein